MNRLLVAATLCVLSAASICAQTRQGFGALKVVRDARAVHLEKSVRLWKNGKWITTGDVVVLRVEVANPYDFAARNAPALQFVYGRSICQIVVSPIVDGVAVLVAPPLDSGDPSAITIIPGIPPEKITTRTLEALGKQPGTPAPRVDPAATRTSYPDLEALRVEAMKAIRPRS